MSRDIPVSDVARQHSRATGARPQQNGAVSVESEVEAPPRRAVWQRLPVLLLVGVLPVPFGLYFLGFVAMVLLLSDRTRDTGARAGGAVLLFWWAYSFR